MANRLIRNGKDITCERCGKGFYVRPNRIDVARYCSWACAYPIATATCVMCGKEFRINPCRKATATCCSAICRGKHSIQVQGGKLVNHNLAGNKHRQGKRPTNAFNPGQNTGANNPMWVAPVVLTCTFCNATFERKPWEVNGKHGHAGKFCSAACRDQYRAMQQSGANSPYWVGGIKTYRGRDWLRTRKIVVLNQAGCCASCGKHVGDSLPVHHIKPYREFASAEEANQLSNLVGMCQSCHMKNEPNNRLAKARH
jgi:hypothetical protein